MAKKYKLVPENLLKRLLEKDEDVPLKRKADDILKQDIPDDLKVLLYSDAARDLHAKQERMRNTPLLVKPVEDVTENVQKADRMPQVLNNQKAIDIHNFLKNHGISYNDEQQVVVNGQAVVNSFYPMMIRGLQNKALGYQPGINEVLRALPSIPPGVSKAVSRSFNTAVTPYKTPTGRRTVIASRRIPKTQEGTGWTCLK